jgi:hypothetical protein
MFHGEGTTKLVPLVAFNMRKITDKSSVTGSSKDELSDFNLGLGIGVNHQINDNNLLVGAVELFGLEQSKDKYTSGGTPSSTSTTTISRTTLPGIYMGIESKFRPWLTGRMGASQVWQISKTKDESTGNPSEETRARASQYNVSFGLGFNFGDFTCDAAINEGIFFDGPNFISGETNSLANRLAVIYKF